MEPAFVLHLPPQSGRLAFGPVYDPYGDGYPGAQLAAIADEIAAWLGPYATRRRTSSRS